MGRAGRGGYGRLMKEGKTYILENFFHRKSFHIKIFAWFGMNYQWDHTGMLEKLFSSEKKVSVENIFLEFFLNDSFNSGSIEDQWQKRKNIFWRNYYSHWNLFSLKKFDSFGMIHQCLYTRMMVLYNIVISGSTECQN